MYGEYHVSVCDLCLTGVDVSMTVSSTEVSESDGEVEVTVSVDAADLSGIIRLGLSTVPISGI